MTGNGLARLQALFDRAVDLPLDERERFVARECAGDAVLWQELTALLQRDAALQGRTSPPLTNVLNAALSEGDPAKHLTGLRVGPFVVRELLGRGGMGSVYRAERVDGVVRQQVAIKLIRSELLDEQTLRRFELERRLLASLDHPHIARLLDANELPDGTPYFVMEYVDGQPITDYCRRHDLDVRTRVQLLRRVCAAVAQAHQHLIVHRDLKPTNILVDAKGVPKLLDFGIAKSLTGDAGGDAAVTAAAMRYFSPQYAAPEQMAGAPIGVACDIYALGLLLFELLADDRPFDFASLSAGQIERLVVEVPPPAPSAALARDGSVRARSRARAVRGELDDIVLRCLRKAPSERYASVEQLDSDLERYLDGRPVLARGGHGWYRARKFLRRNWLSVAALSALVSTMAIGLAAFAWQAKVAERRANDLTDVAEFQGKMIVKAEFNRAGEFLTRTLRDAVSDSLARGGRAAADRDERLQEFDRYWRQVNVSDVMRDLVSMTILFPAEAAVDQEFSDRPLVAATLRQSLALSYWDLGVEDRGLALQRRVVADRRQWLGEDDPETIDARHSLGLLLLSADLPAESEQVMRSVWASYRSVLGLGHWQAQAAGGRLSSALAAQQKWDDAERVLRQLLADQRVSGTSAVSLSGACERLSHFLRKRGRLAEAEQYSREAYALLKESGEKNDWLSVQSMMKVGALLRDQGKVHEAEPFLVGAVESSRGFNGRNRYRHLEARLELAVLLVDLGRLDEAASLAAAGVQSGGKMALESDESTFFGVPAVELLIAGNEQVLADIAKRRGRWDEAESHAREAALRFEQLRKSDHMDRLVATTELATVLIGQGRYAEAADLLEPTEAPMRAQANGDQMHHLARLLSGLGAIALHQRRFDLAEKRLLEAKGLCEQLGRSRSGDIEDALQQMIALHVDWSAAEPTYGSEDKLRELWRQLDLARTPVAHGP